VRPALKADILTAICDPIVYKMWELRRLTNLWACRACYRDSFTFYFFYLCSGIDKYSMSCHMGLSAGCSKDVGLCQDLLKRLWPCRSSAVRRWLPTATARVRVRVACGVCGGQSGTGAGLL
jgi:hypothetical protein